MVPLLLSAVTVIEGFKATDGRSMLDSEPQCANYLNQSPPSRELNSV
jgi:hypothetical protein